MELHRRGDDVTNLVENSGVTDAVLYEIPETKLILGYHINDAPISLTMDHVAAIQVDRELDEDERAAYGEDRLVFSSVLLAGDDGAAAEETIINVQHGDVDDAIEAFERVYDAENNVVDLEETLACDFAVEDGELIDRAPVPETEEA